MTIPAERKRSFIYAERFLVSLLRPKETPRVPLEIRRAARRVIRHFPSHFDIERIAKACPDLLGEWSDNDEQA